MTVLDGTAPSARRRAGHTRALVAAALCLGLALRLAFAFGYWVGKPLTLDEQEYLLLGDSLARGDGLRYPGGQAGRHFERPPGFAMFVAGIFGATGGLQTDRSGVAVLPQSSSGVPASLKLAQCLLGVLGAALIAAIAGQLAGRAAGVAAAGLAALYPPLIWICGYVLAEPLYSFLALACVWLLQNGARRALGGSPLLLVAGLAAGAAILTKEAMIFFVPAAALWLAAGRRSKAALLFCAGVAIVVTPWVVHTHAVYGRFVLTAPHGGVTFWTGNNALARGEGDLAANPAMGRARVAFEQRHAGASAHEMDSAYYREAFDFILDHPLRWVALLARKLFYTVVPIGPSYRLHSTLYFGMSLVSYVLLFSLAMAGIARLAGSADGFSRGWALWLLAASAVLMSVVFFPQERFRIPVLDPVLVVTAAVWVASWSARARSGCRGRVEGFN